MNHLDLKVKARLKTNKKHRINTKTTKLNINFNRIINFLNYNKKIKRSNDDRLFCNWRIKRTKRNKWFIVKKLK